MASVFHAWAPPTLKQHSPGRNVTIVVTWVSPLHSRESRLALFSESNSAPCTLLLFSSQGLARKKQRGRGSQRSEMSELTPAVPPRTSLSLHREFSPVHFTRPGQHPSAAASNLVSFGGRNDGEMDDSLSLAAWDVEELSGSYNDHARTCTGHLAAHSYILIRSPLPSQSTSKDAGPRGLSVFGTAVGPASHTAPSVLAETSSSSTHLASRRPPCQGEPGLRGSSWCLRQVQVLVVPLA